MIKRKRHLQQIIFDSASNPEDVEAAKVEIASALRETDPVTLLWLVSPTRGLGVHPAHVLAKSMDADRRR